MLCSSLAMATEQGPPQENSARPGPSTALVHSVPQASIVSIEHPCIVHDFDNGFKSLGGEPKLKHVCRFMSASLLVEKLTVPRCLNTA